MSAKTPALDVANLRRASRTPVIDALSGFAGKSIDQWLLPNMSAATGQFLKADGKPYRTYSTLTNKFTARQVLDVLAATGPSHCLDGWTYFARALAALLSGDTHTARHLAYYAQLRAALSLLHCHGIGIFNGINFAVDACGAMHNISGGNPNKAGQGTHTAAWEALSGWANHSDTASVFLGTVKFRGVSLLDCIEAVWPSAPGGPLVSEVIEEWGVDLKRSAEDHDARKISSYCAHAFNPSESQLAARLDLVQSIWHGLEPDGNGGFPALDRNLLRKLLDLMKAQQDSEDTPQYGRWENAFQRLDPRVRAFVTRDFLEGGEQHPDLLVFLTRR